MSAHHAPAEVITDRATALAVMPSDLIPAAFHQSRQYENNRRDADHGRLSARLRLMRRLRLKTGRTASIVFRGHANIWNLSRGQVELGVEVAQAFRLAPASDELRFTI